MIALCGYFGFANWGDEAILEAMCRQLESLGVPRYQITVLSGDPAFTEAMHGTKAVYRYDRRAIVRLLRRGPAVVSGGGSLLQDTTSWRTIPYYLGVLELARLFRCPTAVYAQGIGPVHRRLYRRWVGRAFRFVHAGSVRDAASRQCVLQWGGRPENCELAVDPVYSLSSASMGAGHRDDRTLLINLRPVAGKEPDMQLWRKLLTLWQSSGWRITFAALGPGDEEMGARLSAEAELVDLRIRRPENLDEVMGLFAAHTAAVCMRLHGLLFAAVTGCLPLGISYDPKVEAAAEQLGIEAVSMGEVSLLGPQLDALWQHREENRSALSSRVQQLKLLEKHNQNVLRSVLQPSGRR